MTLVTSYNPNSEACCPKCAEIVHCKNIGGIIFGTNPHLDYRHEKCGTEWRYYIYTQKSETPIPKPMTLKECMGESSARPAGSNADDPRYARLYELASEFMALLGAEGEMTIDAHSDFADKWMSALFDIDKGCPGNRQ